MSTEERQGGPPSEPTVVYVQNVPAAQVGDHNVQYISNYNYGPGIWTDNLWDVATKQQIGPALPSNVPENDHPGVVVAWSSNGTTLTASPNSGRDELWNVGYLLTARTPSYLCALAAQTLSPTQWDQYAQGAPYVNVCP